MNQDGVQIDATKIISLVTNPLKDDSEVAPGGETDAKQTIW